MPVPRAQAGQQHRRTGRQGAHCLGGHHRRWQLRRGGARIVSEGGAHQALRSLRSELQVCVWCRFFDFGMEPSTMNLKFARHCWQTQSAACQRDPREDVASDVHMERLSRFGICCYEDWCIWGRGDHACGRGHASSNNKVCQISKDFVVKMWRPGYTYSVVTETVFPEPIPKLFTEVRQGLAHGRGIFAFEVVDTNANMMRATFKPFFCFVFSNWVDPGVVRYVACAVA